ncbi:MAG: nuclear transport factor 2 family protein [Sandaracinaceae bacterium]|nr:nuclear transport factor 2 family protein [Sandaracinaceae bacterium]
MRPHSILIVLASVAASCGGGGSRSAAPDESSDLDVSGGEQRTSTMPPGLDGTQWRWVEARCTEGPLDLLGRGYAARLRAHEREGGLTLVTDQVFATEQCEHTIVMRAVPPQRGPEWQMEEVARVAVPSTRECFGRPEEPRPGEVRVRDGRLEVLVQRSQWCNGLEVTMTYERVPDSLLSEDQIVRRYAAHFTRGDAESVAALFAETGSLLEPFTRTQTGDPYRHDGRAAVQAWFGETFATAPWRALRITDVQTGQTQSGAAQRVVTWEYMDPRLEEPLTGRIRFTIAAGEIFEALIELVSDPHVREGAAGASEPRMIDGLAGRGLGSR